jgi:hypothetical protein
MKWVTRENVHVDGVACPWLIKYRSFPFSHFRNLLRWYGQKTRFWVDESFNLAKNYYA